MKRIAPGQDVYVTYLGCMPDRTHKMFLHGYTIKGMTGCAIVEDSEGWVHVVANDMVSAIS